MKNKNGLIKKSNSLNEAYVHLSLVEYRILQIAFASLSKEEINPQLMRKVRFEITAQTYMELYGCNRNAAYESLQVAAEKLFSRYFSYWVKVSEDSNLVERVKSRWVSKIAYQKEQAKVSLWLSEDVLSMVGDLQKKYTYFHLYKISNLTSMYSVRVYELLVQWRKTDKVPSIEINDLRAKLGVEKHEYKRMYDFKKYVLDVSVKQINEHTDIMVSYQQIKNGRNIVGFDFKFKQKEKPIKDVVPNKFKNIAPPTLTDSEEKAIKKQAEKYISKKGITDENHKKNIHKKALAEGWGLDEYRQKQAEEEKHKKQAEEEKQRELEQKRAEEEKRKKEKKELDECEEKFLKLAQPIQNIVLETLENRLPMPFKKNFKIDLEGNDKAYRNVEYAGTFKQIMKDF